MDVIFVSIVELKRGQEPHNRTNCDFSCDKDFLTIRRRV